MLRGYVTHPVTLLWSWNYKNPTFSNIFQSFIGYAKMLRWYVTHPVTVLQSWNYKNPTFFFKHFPKCSLVASKVTLICYAPVTLIWSWSDKHPTFFKHFPKCTWLVTLKCYADMLRTQSWNYKNPTFWFFSNIFQVFLGCIKCYADMLRTSYPALKLKW